MHAVLIENPTAHNVTPAGRLVVERALEATFDLELVTTQRRGHAAELAREAAEAGAKAVIVHGGDGTVNEAVNGLMGTDSSTNVVLGLLPGGGTNVLARALGYPNTLIEAAGHLINLVAAGPPVRIGVGRLKATGPQGPIERVFTFGAGLVLDADMVRRVEESGWRPRLGDMAFVIHGFRTFFDMRSEEGPALVVHRPDGPPVDAWWAMLSKSDPFTYFRKRPVRVAPDALHTRGLDVTAGKTVKFVRTLRWLQQVLGSGRHVNHKDCLYLRDQAYCLIEARRPVTLQADGEHLGQVDRLEAEAVPDALPVWA